MNILLAVELFENMMCGIYPVTQTPSQCKVSVCFPLGVAVRIPIGGVKSV